MRPLRAVEPSGGDRPRVRPAAPAGPPSALQHRADAAGADHSSERDRRARARAGAMGTRPALGEGPVDRRADDQRARRDARHQACVPQRLRAASLPAARERLLRMAADASRQAADARRHGGRAPIRPRRPVRALAFARRRSPRHVRDRDHVRERGVARHPRPDAGDRPRSRSCAMARRLAA